MDLNDDCLIEILERVSIFDLSSIGKLGSRLKELVFKFFERKHKILKLTFDKKVENAAEVR